MEWQPIETAPKDGTHIIVYGKPTWGEDGPIGVCYWRQENEARWELVDEDTKKRVWKLTGYWWGSDVEPTHWMPLPEPPE